MTRLEQALMTLMTLTIPLIYSDDSARALMTTDDL
jgi:hypothetical protein